MRFPVFVLGVLLASPLDFKARIPISICFICEVGLQLRIMKARRPLARFVARLCYQVGTSPLIYEGKALTCWSFVVLLHLLIASSSGFECEAPTSFVPFLRLLSSSPY